MIYGGLRSDEPYYGLNVSISAAINFLLLEVIDFQPLNFGSQSMKKRKSHQVAEQWSSFPRGVDQIHVNNIFD